MLLPGEAGARSLFLPEHYSHVRRHVFSCLTTGDKHAFPLLAADCIFPAVTHGFFNYAQPTPAMTGWL